METDGTHGFGNAGSLAVNNRQCCLRCDIAGSQAGAASGENEVQLFLIAPLTQDRLDLLAFVRNNGPGADNASWHLGHHSANIFIAGIWPRPLCATITDSQYANSNHE